MRDTALVIDSRSSGSNLKVANLENMLPAARHDILVLADSDMRVDPGYLGVVTAPFQLALAAVTCVPDWAQVAFQPWLTFWEVAGKSNSSFHEVSGSPRLVKETPPWNPPCH